MKPRRLQSATILSIVTTSSLRSCSGIGPDGIGARLQAGPERVCAPQASGAQPTKRTPLTYPGICVYIRCVLLLTR